MSDLEYKRLHKLSNNNPDKNDFWTEQEMLRFVANELDNDPDMKRELVGCIVILCYEGDNKFYQHWRMAKLKTSQMLGHLQALVQETYYEWFRNNE